MDYYFINSIKTDSLPKHDRAIALGAFDGVHIGHLSVISKTKDVGGLVSSVLTFNQNATSLPKNSVCLYSEEEKHETLKQAGVSEILDFDFGCIQNLSPEEFVTCVLRDFLHCKLICCGENTRFGHGGCGDVAKLKELCEKEGIQVLIANTVFCDGVAVSSSQIRQYLQNGQIREATRMLGRSFSICKTVEGGNHVGHKVGFPTINQCLNEHLVCPRFGVYQSCVEIDNHVYPSLTNIGVKPTVGSEKPLAETWIPHFEGNLYNQTLKIRLVSFMRDEQKFASLDALKEQIEKDFSAFNKAITPSQSIKAVLFDFDETLQDRTVAFRRYAERFVLKHFPHLSFDEQEERIQTMWERNGNGHAYFNKETYIPYPIYFKELIALWNWENAPSIESLIEEVEEILPSETCLFDGAEETLKQVRKKGYLVGVITNGFSKMQNRKLAVSGLRPYFDITIVSGDEGMQKPNGEVFFRAAARLGVAPEDCVYVGDHPYYDMEGARNGHMQSIYLDAFNMRSWDKDIPRITAPLELLNLL